MKWATRSIPFQFAPPNLRSEHYQFNRRHKQSMTKRLEVATSTGRIALRLALIQLDLKFLIDVLKG